MEENKVKYFQYMLKEEQADVALLRRGFLALMSAYAIDPILGSVENGEEQDRIMNALAEAYECVKRHRDLVDYYTRQIAEAEGTLTEDELDAMAQKGGNL